MIVLTTLSTSNLIYLELNSWFINELDVSRTDLPYLDSSAVLVAGHSIHLVHDEDVFTAHRLGRAYETDGQRRQTACKHNHFSGS